MLVQVIIAAVGVLLLVVITAIAAFLLGRHLGKSEALRGATKAAAALTAPVPKEISRSAPAASTPPRVIPPAPTAAPAPPAPKRPVIKWAPPPPTESSAPKEVDLSHADPYLNWLFAEGGAVDGKSYHVGRRTVTVGRGDDNFIQVATPEFSRTHCRITPTDEGLEVEDLHSSNGILFHDNKTQSFLLRNGESFQIGHVKFLYHQIANFDVDAVAEKKKAGPWVRMATVLSQQPIPRPVYLDEDAHNPDPQGWNKLKGSAPLLEDDGDLLTPLDDDAVDEPTWGGIGEESGESTTNVKSGGGPLESKSSKELRAYLWDDTWRLQAALQLMHRGDTDAIPDVFRAAETMEAREQSALLEGMPAGNDAVENAILGFLDVGAPTGVYLAACTLAGMQSQRALPRLFELIEDPARVPTARFFAQAFIPYGEGLIGELTPRLLAAGDLEAEHPLVLISAALSAAIGSHIWQQIEADVPALAGLRHTA